MRDALATSQFVKDSASRYTDQLPFLLARRRFHTVRYLCVVREEVVGWIVLLLVYARGDLVDLRALCVWR